MLASPKVLLFGDRFLTLKIRDFLGKLNLTRLWEFTSIIWTEKSINSTPYNVNHKFKVCDPRMHRKHWQNLDLFLEGPEDDSKGVEACRPKIVFYVTDCCGLTDILYRVCTYYIRHCLLFLHAGPVTTVALKRVLLNIITEGVLGGMSSHFDEIFWNYFISCKQTQGSGCYWNMAVQKRNLILSIFRHVYKTVVKSDLASLYPPVPLYVCRELSGHFLEFLLKHVDAFRFLLKSDKNGRHFTWRPTRVYDHVPRLFL